MWEERQCLIFDSLSAEHIFLAWRLSDKESSCMQEMQLRFLGQEDPLEKEMATRLVFLPEKCHGAMDRGAWQATVHGVAKELGTT